MVEAIGEWVERKLVSKYHFTRQTVPTDADLTRWFPDVDATAYPRVPIYLSANATTASKLLLLVQGSGVVRPGQWSRSVIINEGLGLGTMFPYIERAFARGYAVAILNPNLNRADVDGEKVCRSLCRHL